MRGSPRGRAAPRRQLGGGARPPAAWLAAAAALLTLLFVPAAPLQVAVCPDRPPAQRGLPWLSVRNGTIVDTAGRQVLLRGFNDDALLHPPARGPASPLAPADARLMEAQGFDVVRLPIAWSSLEPRPGVYSRRYLDRIVALVARCTARRLYVVIDMHTQDFGPAFGGIGAPRWLRVPLVPNWHLFGLRPPWSRHLSPAVNAALTAFWLTPAWQAAYWGALAHVARRLAGDSGVAGYDLYNEPHPLPLPPLLFETRLLWPFYAQGIRTVARVDPNHLFIVEGDLFAGWPTPIRSLAAPDLVFSAHLYAGVLLGSRFRGRTGPLAAELDQALAEARQLPAAYWTGELGIPRTDRRAAAWARAELRLADRARVGWAWWQWADAGRWGVRSRSGQVSWSWLRVLAQPYPQAAPGRLRTVGYDPSARRLTVVLAGAAPGSRLRIGWPAWLGPPMVEGGCARPAAPWRAAAGTLTLVVAGPACRLVLRPR